MILDLIIILILALFGIGLIILEVFFIPGFGFAGIGGILFMGGAVWFSYEQLGTMIGNITLLASIIFLIISFYFFVKSKMLTRIALKKEIKSTSPNLIENCVNIGDEGLSISRINPMGTVLINNQPFEAKSEEGFIEENTKVVVTKVFPTQIIIKEL